MDEPSLMLHLGLRSATAMPHFATRGEMGIGIMLLGSSSLGCNID